MLCLKTPSGFIKEAYIPAIFVELRGEMILLLLHIWPEASWGPAALGHYVIIDIIGLNI